MKAKTRITVWVSGCTCLILLISGVFIYLHTNRTIPAELTTLVTPTNLTETPNTTAETAAVTSTQPHLLSHPDPAVKPQPTALTSTPVPLVTYPLGSIGEACDVNEYPLYHRDVNHRLENYPAVKGFEKSKCQTALATYMNPINPNLWGRENDTHGHHSAHALISIDNPLTFERIFTDPAGDFAKVQEALARPECQLGDDSTSNWKLHETCHADAIHNYAYIYRYCSNQLGVFSRPRQYYSKQENPTPEQDRGMWIEVLESVWILEKCAPLGQFSNLPKHTKLRQQIHTLQISDDQAPQRERTVSGALINLAARLGDEAAALTYPGDYGSHFNPHDEEGYKYGPFAEWFTADLDDPTNLFSKLTPSIDRLHKFIPLFANNIEVSGKSIKFDHEVLVQHLCAPPYYTPPADEEKTDTAAEPRSCREIVTELRQKSLHTSMLEELTTFEDVAIRLDVYE
ncbi:MAG: hypothetical protein OXH84_02345 [Gammaproteobacteria bacterium]|nr:hypothetical protein [Gammaproteobacteria bacterium]